VILKRYDRDLPYRTTHITTNLSADQLMERYDNRAMDRMRAMFNIIDFPITEKSRRK
jgi:DNA replication protein DnaC